MATNQTTPTRLWNRDFLLLWQGVAESKLGSVLYAIGIGVWVYDRTDSAALMGLMTSFSYFGALVLQPLGGVLADRWRKRTLIAGSDLVCGVVMLALGALAWQGRMQVWQVLAVAAVSAVCASVLQPAVNSLLPAPVLNFMLIGMSFSTVFANMVSEQQLNDMMQVMNPIIGFAMIIVILNLAAPLDYHLIFGAGIYTAIYIVARAIGKYSGAYFGAAVTHAPRTVRKYLGFTLLPHSGVSLVFTGIAVSVLQGPAPECAQIIQGTIAAAAVINEIIAVFMAKKGFEWAGELHQAEGGSIQHDTKGKAGTQPA